MSLPSIAQMETSMLTAWPSLMTAYDGAWVWRAGRGYTNRSNSISCLDPNDGEDALARLARFSELYTRHGLPSVFKVTPLTSAGALEALETLRWQSFGESHVLAQSLHPRGSEPRHHTALMDALDPAWLDPQADMAGYGPSTVDTLKQILAVVPCDHRGVVAFDAAGVPAASALTYVANGNASFTNVVARESHRGQGFGRAVMVAALNWARDAGAVTASLQVAAGNATAITLYTSLGFAHAYDYVYRRPPTA